MKVVTVFALSLALLSNSSKAGTITGTVRAEGRTPAEDDSGGKYDSRKYKFAERIDYASLRDFVVYVEGSLGTNAVTPLTHVEVVTTKRVTQRGAMFDPHVLPVMVGTTVDWPNNDDILHNVFSMSEAKPFDLQLYKRGDPGKQVLFDKAGRVDVYCSIHANMHCVVLVLENPCFAVSNDRDRYSITNIPPGTYKVKAWHERLPPQTQEVVVPEAGEAKADFVLGIKNLPKY